jgi:hypothetical protein
MYERGLAYCTARRLAQSYSDRCGQKLAALEDMKTSITSNRPENYLSTEALSATKNGRHGDNNDGNDSKHTKGDLKIECENCNKETQKPLPDLSTYSCTSQYESVQKCMEYHHGQVSSCKIQWEELRSCHNNHKYNRKDRA